MALPKIEHSMPTVSVTLPVSGKKVKIRPFTVKEEKLFLMIKEGSTFQEILQVVSDTMSACTFGKLDTSTIPIADLEHLFLQVRIIAKGEIQEVNFTCKNNVIDEETKEERKCNTKVLHRIDLSKVSTIPSEGFTRDIPIKGTPLVIRMKHPNINHVISSIESKADVGHGVMDMFKSLVDQVIDTKSNEVYSEYTEDELTEFFDSLPRSTFDLMLENYWLKYPQLRHVVHFECPMCKHKEDIKFAGLADFFT